jgi:hypothetical protein
MHNYGTCEGGDSLPAPGGAPPELEESDAGGFAGGILGVMVDYVVFLSRIGTKLWAQAPGRKRR